MKTRIKMTVAGLIVSGLAFAASGAAGGSDSATHFYVRPPGTVTATHFYVAQPQTHFYV